eukprot:scaffold82_cov366-Pavlova_lutheri.AAC.5
MEIPKLNASNLPTHLFLQYQILVTSGCLISDMSEAFCADGLKARTSRGTIKPNGLLHMKSFLMLCGDYMVQDRGCHVGKCQTLHARVKSTSRS